MANNRAKKFLNICLSIRGKDLISFYPQQILAAAIGLPYIYLGKNYLYNSN
jgi:hypothetical protein